ncbi:MAG: hypothetical protein FVQ80_11625 [Planctomycetes bacterium]|nr:hypothetical protein [Planctomycetota bacterium]
MVNINIKDFSVSYFPPYDKYYLSNGRKVYLTVSGNVGPVYYWDTRKSAENALEEFKALE